MLLFRSWRCRGWAGRLRMDRVETVAGFLRASRTLLLGVLIATIWGAPAFARPFVLVNCALQIPDDWTISGAKANGPEGHIKATLLSMPTHEIAEKVLKDNGAVRSGGGAGSFVMTQGPVAGPPTKIYGVSTATPACVADITVSGGDASVAAKIAASVGPKP
jgi:hypothetical protein